MWHRQWLAQLDKLRRGEPIAPRGQLTYEALDEQLVLADARGNLLDVPERSLSFRFAVAEWLWMSFGHSDVETIARYNSNIAQFSDDGVSFAGAYGPHIGAQRPRVLDKLRRDPATRQAVIEIPRPYNAGPTRDEPCTLSFQFLHRGSMLHLIATMRSSDAWLGLPYDVFNFTQLQNAMAGELGLESGWFSLHLGSSHLYDRNAHASLTCLSPTTSSMPPRTLRSPQLPGWPPAWLDRVLTHQSVGDVPRDAPDVWRWYADVLCAPSNRCAHALLTSLSALA